VIIPSIKLEAELMILMRLPTINADDEELVCTVNTLPTATELVTDVVDVRAV
jgi:hypothetical protein